MNVKGMVTALVLVIVGIIVIFQIVGNTSGELTNASANISGSGFEIKDNFLVSPRPLANLFASNGDFICGGLEC